jgi:hypothetical protein
MCVLYHNKGHYGFHSFPVVDWYTYEFWLSVCKIARSSVILLLPLYVTRRMPLVVGIIQFESSMSRLTRFSYNPEYNDIAYS